ncbi:MAG: RsmE family RNA methyltransferase [Hyphomicrobium sp.]
MRLAVGAEILVFNGQEGEWRAKLVEAGKRRCTLQCGAQTLPQVDGPRRALRLCPAEACAGLDYMVQKATELGVAHLQPVLTRRTVATRVNLERMRANAIEAAEQCGVLRVPSVGEPVKLEALLAEWNPGRRLIFCDEAADISSPIAALADVGQGPLAVLIGPEGGFDAAERAMLRGKPFTAAISLGPAHHACRHRRGRCAGAGQRHARRLEIEFLMAPGDSPAGEPAAGRKRDKTNEGRRLERPRANLVGGGARLLAALSSSLSMAASYTLPSSDSGSRSAPASNAVWNSGPSCFMKPSICLSSSSALLSSSASAEDITLLISQ